MKNSFKFYSLRYSTKFSDKRKERNLAVLLHLCYFNSTQILSQFLCDICILLGLTYPAVRQYSKHLLILIIFTKEVFAYAKQPTLVLYRQGCGHSI